MHTRVVGRGPAPDVVLGSGLGGSWFDWQGVTDIAGRFAQVTVYDRPVRDSGLPRPPSLADDVAVLDAVLGRIRGPAVLAGHSLATVHMEAFARLRPDRVRGVVLIDPDPEEIGAGKPFDPGSVLASTLLSTYRLPPIRAVAAWVVRRFGVRLRRAAIRSSTVGRADPAAADLVREVYSRPEVAESVLAQLAAYSAQVAELDALRAARPLPDVPWVVLTAEHSASPETLALHRKLAELVPGGRQETVPASKHMVPIDRPDAIARVLAEVLGSTGV